MTTLYTAAVHPAPLKQTQEAIDTYVGDRMTNDMVLETIFTTESVNALKCQLTQRQEYPEDSKVKDQVLLILT